MHKHKALFSGCHNHMPWTSYF